MDNVKGFEKEASYGTVDMRYEYLYQWWRELCAEFKFFGLALSQMNGEAEGEAWPKMSNLKGSSTAKQGACDVIIFGGRESLSNPQRFISTPKNKSEFREPGSDPATMATVNTDFSIGRFYREPTSTPWE